MSITKENVVNVVASTSSVPTSAVGTSVSTFSSRLRGLLQYNQAVAIAWAEQDKRKEKEKEKEIDIDIEIEIEIEEPEAIMGQRDNDREERSEENIPHRSGVRAGARRLPGSGGTNGLNVQYTIQATGVGLQEKIVVAKLRHQVNQGDFTRNLQVRKSL